MHNKILFLILAALLFNLPLANAEGQARDVLLADIRGQVMVREDGKEWKPAMAGTTLHESDEIRTGPDGFAEMLMDGGETANVQLKENSYFKLRTMTFGKTSGEKTTLLDLAIGKVLVHAEKLKNDSKFEVRTPTSTTGVRGTIFEVSVEEAKK